MKSQIHQEIVVAAAPAAVYAALIDGAQFSRMCGGAPAEIDPAPGGAFSCFGGMIAGRNIECEPGRRLVQAWRVKNWEPGVYSIARFEFRPEGAATRVVLDHTGFPEEQQPHLEQGWHQNYWNPLQQMLA
jgi:activator of HSP90 ATPase